MRRISRILSDSFSREAAHRAVPRKRQTRLSFKYRHGVPSAQNYLGGHIALVPHAPALKPVDGYLKVATKKSDGQTVNRILASTFVILLVGCAQAWSRVDTARTAGPDKSYMVDLPIGWIKETTSYNQTLLASRDGLLLESISITKQVSPYPQKEGDVQALSAKLAELEIAKIKSQDQFTAALAVVQNEPAEVSGRKGFNLRVRFKNTRGLEIQRVVYGFVDQTEYYQLSFQAPMLYYFDRYYPDFQKAVESFQLAAAKK